LRSVEVLSRGSCTSRTRRDTRDLRAHRRQLGLGSKLINKLFRCQLIRTHSMAVRWCRGSVEDVLEEDSERVAEDGAWRLEERRIHAMAVK